MDTPTQLNGLPVEVKTMLRDAMRNKDVFKTYANAFGVIASETEITLVLNWMDETTAVVSLPLSTAHALAAHIIQASANIESIRCAGGSDNDKT